MIKAALKTFSYIIYPRRCKLCGEVVQLSEELCDECENAEFLEGNLCLKCGREKDGCVCKKEKFSPKYKAFTAPYYYEGCMEKAVIRFKNYGYKELAPEMSKRIVQAIKKNFENSEFDCVCCVPMTKRKLRKRGYNQSELLARETALLLGIDYVPALIKTRESESQRFSSANKRRVNLYGAFDLSEGVSVEGKTVLIIDDVKTTGSTLNECAEVLMSYKAKAVFAGAFTVTKKKQ